jgi:predicted metal-dependent phosphoesterase TrpH
MFSDLHNHTINSDGELSLINLINLAKRNNIKAIAVTDHDRIHNDLNQNISKINEIEVINGIELRVEINDSSKVDLLGYGVSPTYELEKELDIIKESRKERASIMISNLENDFNIDMDIDISDNIGRPHIARNFSEKTNYSYQQTFDEIICTDCDYYESRYVTDLKKGVELLNNSCELVSLAHPYRYEKTFEIINLIGSMLDGLEYYYPYSEDVNLNKLKDCCLNHNLIITGGSDTHKKKDFGRSGLNEKQYKKFKNHI